MNITLKATSIAILTVFAHLAHADVEITAKLIDAPPDVNVTTDLAPLNQIKGVDILYAPRVTTRSGQRATVEVMRPFQIPEQEPVDLGVSFQFKVDATSSSLTYTGRYTHTDFEGFSDSETKQNPIFETIVMPFNGSIQDSVPVLIEIKRSKDAKLRRYIYLMIKNV